MKKLLKSMLLISTLTLTGCSIEDFFDVSDNFVINATDKKQTYLVGETYDSFVDKEGLNVTYQSSKETKQIYKDVYTYVLKDVNGASVNAKEAFKSEGLYNVDVSYKKKSFKNVTIKVINDTSKVSSISITPSETPLTVGKSVSLTANVLPSTAKDKSVTWSSSSDSVAIVTSSGTVTGCSTGSATITATANDGSGVKGTAIINVQSASTDVKITNLLISPSSKSLKVGESFSITKTIIPSNATNKTLTFTSSDSSVITVDDNGKVSAKGEGTAQITVKTVDGSNISKVCSVSVEAAPVLVQNITLSSTSLSLEINDITKLTATVSPENAANKTIAWTALDSSVVSVKTDGTVTAVGVGSTTITAKASDGSGVKATCSVTVKNSAGYIPVTGISLNETSKTVDEGDTFSLEATLQPSNATNRSVSWSSSNETVAKVSGAGTVTTYSSGTAVITAKSLDNTSKTATCYLTVNKKAGSKGAWTILLYMCGSDLESDSYQGGQATADLKEIKSVTNQPSDVNIVVEAGGSKSWKTGAGITLSSSKLNRFHLRNKAYVMDEQIANDSMGKSSTLQSFLEWGIENYPADKYGLILWNHGGGLRGVCYDENYSDDSLLNKEVITAVKNSFTNKHIDKFEFIGYDACLMQTMEVAEFNSKYFNYQVGSEESESGTGWDYDTWVDDLYAKKDTKTILKAIVDGFIKDNGGADATGGWYQSSYGYGSEYYPADQTLSYLDLTKMAAFKDAWESMAGVLKGKITSSNKSSFNSNIIGKTKYFAGSDYDSFCLFDAGHFLEVLEANSTFNPGSSYISSIKSAMNDLICYNLVQKEAAHDAHGLSFYYTAGTGYSQSNYNSSTYSNFTNWIAVAKNGGYINSSYQY